MNINNLRLLKAARLHGTPSYLYDGEQIIKNYKSLKNALPEFVDVFYALKVNPNVSLVHLLRTKGACTEVCSLTEMEIALKAGSIPEDIIFLGPCKKEYELKRALELNIFALVIESETELERVSNLAKEMGVTANVAIRLNPDFSADGSPWKMGGRPTQFGIDEKHAVENFGTYLQVPNINIRGIHVYNGTSILDAESVFQNTRYILNLYDTITKKYGTKFSMVDVGGGMGIPYFANQTPLDIQKFEDLMKPLFEEFHATYPETRIIMESGRFILGTAGYLAVEVNNIKVNHNKTFVITDGGTNCHSAAAGSGRVVKRNFPMENISADVDAKEFEYQVSGPLCSPDDILGRNIKLKEVNVSDILVVKSSGAYGPTSSPGLFHSHGFPAEILVYNDEMHLIRKKDKPKDMIERQVLVNFNVQTPVLDK
ncbi:diaminopimelate decarboxylase [Tenacibaculum sp. MAR_2009_124]|uniref:diaminopimelate decarboxylase n=1 Tax=Tenacibaculum sp. MAR_2009_124 TaxID=1250059 RepID=UPI00089B9967|nr:diaminopimelate decarboxylase [Tenacibaculum sp. MAR_2009_124]SEB49594.1 diaminopimelate decarboxylase [Tenacibaculum sp. MAR_2009_124]